MADGRHKPLAELDVGDAIYGTRPEPKYRRYALTTVLDKWITIKPAYRVVLEDGTELIVERRPPLSDATAAGSTS